MKYQETRMRNLKSSKASSLAFTKSHWKPYGTFKAISFVAVVLFLAANNRTPTSSGLFKWKLNQVLAQKNEASELPEDCDPNLQYYHAADSKCRNCSDVMRLFEPSYQEWLETVRAGSSADNSETVTISTTSQVPASSSSSRNSSNRQFSETALNDNVRTLISRLTPLPASNQQKVTTAQSARQPSGRDQANAILSRLVLAGSPPTPSDASEETESERATQLGSAGDGGSSSLAPGAGDWPTADGSFPERYSQEPGSDGRDNELADRQESPLLSSRASMARQARRWQRLLVGFLRSREILESGLLEAIGSCRADQNSSACQMWSNMCVLTMYSHSEGGGGSVTSQPGAPAKSRSNLGVSRAASTRWQECPRFSLASICNSLREWHRSEKSPAAAESVTDIFYDGASSGSGSSSSISALDQVTPRGFLGAVPLVPFKLDQLIQLLAYEYALDGRLVSVRQFDLRDLAKFCLFSRALATSGSDAISANQQDDLSTASRSTSSDEQQKDNKTSQQQQQHQRDDKIRVGQSASLSCRFNELQASKLAAQHLNETTFIDLFIGYQLAGATFIKPVPILVKNLLILSNNNNNAAASNSPPQMPNVKYAKDPSRWKLVHRYFPLASMRFVPQESNQPEQKQGTSKYNEKNKSKKSGNYVSNFDRLEDNEQQQQQHEHEEQQALVFARDVNLEIKFKRQAAARGLVINSMLLHIEYDFIVLSKDNKGESLTISPIQSIRVTQSQLDMPSYLRDLDLLLTIFCLISAIWSLIKCYNIQKYQGAILKLDLYSLALFLVIACDIIGNLLALATGLFALYLYGSVKLLAASSQGAGLLAQLQQVLPSVMPPDEATELNLLLKLKLALCFKLLGLAYELYTRLCADLFFIDWERPKMLTSSQLAMAGAYQAAAPASSQANQQKLAVNQQQQQQISFWRPYTIINRWLALQTSRRLNLTLQLIALTCCLELVNLNQLTTLDAASASFKLLGGKTRSQLDHQLEPRLEPNESALYRALLLAILYLSLASVQIAYKKLLYEPMIRCSVREFADLCSVANVSLFAMLYPRYGFYLHGRNANGSGDTGIAEMNVLLEREGRDLCSKRGLLPNSDQQTFVMLLPRIINDHYRKLLFRHDHHHQQQHLFATSLGEDNSKLMTQQQQQQNQATNLIKSALSLPGSLAPGGSNLPLDHRSIESIVARNRAINLFLVNFIDHTYTDIDYTIRERRRFDSLLAMEFELNIDDDADTAAARLSPGTRKVPPASIGSMMSMMVMGNSGPGQQSVGAHAKAATLFVDHKDSFASLLWRGLEWNLLLVELFALLYLDLILGKDNLILTISLLWLINKFFKSAYNLMARKNLVTKSMLDEKFLIRS